MSQSNKRSVVNFSCSLLQHAVQLGAATAASCLVQQVSFLVLVLMAVWSSVNSIAHVNKISLRWNRTNALSAVAFSASTLLVGHLQLLEISWNLKLLLEILGISWNLVNAHGKFCN